MLSGLFQSLNVCVIVKTHRGIFHVSSKVGSMAGSLADTFRHVLTTSSLVIGRFLIQEFTYNFYW